MARPQSFPVRLTQEQREALEQARDQPLARKQQYRRDILLRADEGDTDPEMPTSSASTPTPSAASAVGSPSAASTPR